MLYKSIGKMFIGRDGSVKVLCDPGIIHYYKHVIEKAHWGLVKTQLPKHGAHISIVLPSKHKNVDIKALQQYRGVKVGFKYDPDIQEGNSIRGFTNYWLKVECPFADFLKKKHNIVDTNNFKGLHITICNTKYILNNNKVKN